MTPPDTDLKKQKRQHRGPLIGMALVVIIGVGVIVYWVGEEIVEAPTPDTEPEATSPADPADVPEGAVDATEEPSETLQPTDPEVEVDP